MPYTKNKMRLLRTCMVCNGTFVISRQRELNRQFCSRTCQGVGSRGLKLPRAQITCAHCGGLFADLPSHAHRRVYCSAACKNRAIGLRTAALPLRPKFEQRAVKVESGCWLWSGQCTAAGYGTLALGSEVDGTAHVEYAHRISHRLFKGEIPEGWAIDHLCRVPNCVNPDHLEAVPHGENTRRAWVAKKAGLGRSVPVSPPPKDQQQ